MAYDDLRTCRFCLAQSADLFRYGRGAYAHAKCLLDRKGGSVFLDMPLHDLHRFPYFVAKAAGALEWLEAATRRREAER